MSAGPRTARRVALTCEAGEEGARLDAWLARRLPEYSRGYLKALIDGGRALAGGKVRKPSHKLAAGEVVELDVPEPLRVALAPEPVELDICYEDEHLLVVNKPRGMLTHPTSSKHPGGSLVNALLAHCRDLGGINGELRPGIVHRLDRDTSGLLVVAKNDTAQRELAAQFRLRTVDKRYYALVRGRVRPKYGQMVWPIARHPVHRTRMRVDEAHGRAALTEYRVLATYAATTFVQVALHTGRTHQIRVHFAHLGHPLVGDVLYGSRCEASLFAGVALHSAKLAFNHPVTGRRIRCRRPLPADFRELVRRAAKGDPLEPQGPSPLAARP